jgi:hypothetical protein
MLRGPVQDLDGIAPASSALCRSALVDLNQARLGYRATFIPLMQIKAADWSATNIEG